MNSPKYGYRSIAYLIDSYTKEMGLNSIDDKIQAAAPFIFNGSFPIFDEGYRLPLECKILRHYYFREFSADTDEQFKFYLISRLREIMPRYNQLYKTVLSQFNYLTDFNITTTETEIFGNSGTNDFYSSGDYNNTSSSTSNLTGNTTNTNTANTTFSNNGNLNSNETTNGTITTGLSSNRTDHGESTNQITGSENGTTEETTTSQKTDNKTFHNLSSDLPQMNYNNIDYGTNMQDSNENIQSNSNGTNNQTTNKHNQSDSTTTSENNSEYTENGKTQSNSTTTGDQTTTNSGNSNIQDNSDTHTTSSTEYNGNTSGTDTRGGWNDFTKSGASQRIRKESGIRGNKSPTELLILYRESIINPDMDIIRDLEDLFIFVYN